MQDFNFDNSFALNLEDFFVSCESEPSSSPKLLKLNYNLAKELGLKEDFLNSKEGLNILSGNTLPKGSNPIAQAYSGHQFGGFTPLLGDGRALLLGEVITTQQERKDIQLKGSGRTPFSRGGDGKSALGPVLREYLLSEFMHVLGIPTTRALAAVSTGDSVNRDTVLPGGILTRIASSHIRIGTFQFATALGDATKIKTLTDYCMERHYPDSLNFDNPYLKFFESIADAQSSTVASWMNVGFIHGVMNTDNMTVSGETIDYGPCAFMESFSEKTVFSSIDVQGRYAYGNQPEILNWNLTRLAETLVPLVDSNQEKSVELLTQKIEKIPSLYQEYWLQGMRKKVGLSSDEPADLLLIKQLLKIMEIGQADFTLVFRRLSESILGNDEHIEALFKDTTNLKVWLKEWKKRITKESRSKDKIAQSMDSINPMYIARNHKVEEALLDAVENDNISLFEELHSVLSNPYVENKEKEEYALPAPESDVPYKTFCGT
jgi:serine/tyrosine/threonine adenylyltransferase